MAGPTVQEALSSKVSFVTDHGFQQGGERGEEVQAPEELLIQAGEFQEVPSCPLVAQEGQRSANVLGLAIQLGFHNIVSVRCSVLKHAQIFVFPFPAKRKSLG